MIILVSLSGKWNLAFDKQRAALVFAGIFESKPFIKDIFLNIAIEN